MPFSPGDKVVISLGGCERAGVVRLVRTDGKLTIEVVFRAKGIRRKRRVVRSAAFVQAAPTAAAAK